MIVLEFKLKDKPQQYRVIDEMIRTAQFVRNKALRYWIDNQGVKLSDLYKQCAIMAKEFEWAGKLNSMARQASAERAIFAIQRFFANCKAKKPGKKGYPQFKTHTRSVEYKTSGWALSTDKRSLTFTDGFAAGKFKLIGSRDLHFYAPNEIKRVRVIHRADGYYAQFCINVERTEELVPTGKAIGIDVGLNHFLTDSDGEKVPNPRHLRQSERALKRLQKRVSRKKKGSGNRKKAINKLGRKHLKVSRQRKDFAIKTALCVVKSSDFVAHEDLQVRNMVKNHKLAKSISSAAWSQFTQWLQYFGKVYGKTVVAVAPQYTSQDCSNCGNRVLKSLSVRTHVCSCGAVLDRDHNAALNVLAKGLKQAGINLNTAGHAGINAWGQIDKNSLVVTSTGKLTG
ncbi:MAG: transposase [Oscillatoriales cyanobacterium]|uniref:Transposase n=1 Tax=Microcoleus anatoxicus PTRS2 TaxID=2705321 RepID=A0ABU8YLF7_9CYAN|nr:MAG: transposase [Oscillatoriales cyanobacterium]TAD96491.1 MAG: transposase [Oscillatoriales cyanobacterium]TAE04566.1 MAG: transposase [Oscillatoriales cyanobacterium]TAF00390.1 MAG: transposase [Oscillatoriales cyanobacterium]TAF36767.1 MAG: transposase [Oscillatoriales cyanobacterium]